MACGEDPADQSRTRRKPHPQAAGMGAQIVCLQELFRSQYFCREEDARLFDLAETIPGPSTEVLCPLAAELGRGGRRVALREARDRPVSQHRRHHRCRWHAAGNLPEDAYPGRSAVLRKVLLHARRSGLPRVRHEVRPHRDAGLLGSVVSRSGASGGAHRRQHSVLSDRYRLASGGEGRMGRGPARCVAHGPARARHRQWHLRGGGESRGL